MEVFGPGDFFWGGANEFKTTNAAAGNVVDMLAGSKTTILTGMRLDATNHNVNLIAGGRLNVEGDNTFDVRESNLNGTMWFNLAAATVNDNARKALLTSKTPSGTKTDTTGAIVVLGSIPMSHGNLKAGDRYYLIDAQDTAAPAADNQITFDAQTTKTASARQGLLKQYNFIIDNESDTTNSQPNRYLVARLAAVGQGGPPPVTLITEAKALTDGQTALLGMLAQTTSWLPDHSYEQADLALQATANHWSPFGGLDGTMLETGRHGTKIRTDATRLMAGLAWQKPFDSSKFLAGLFVEGNFGRYHVDGEYGTWSAHVKAKGDIETIDAGLMLRQTWNSGFRLEASGRVGRARFDFKSPSFDDPAIMVDTMEYKYESPFLAAHAGVGYEHPLNDVSSLDFVARYYYTRMNSESVALSTGEVVNFDDMVSNRVRGGVRYSRQHNPRMKWYVGGYWEQEFDGKALGEVHGINFESNELRGGTAVGEIGLVFKSTPDRPWNVEAGVQGYGGANRGFSGGFRFGYEF
jgi:hypothetical protein